MLCFLHLNIFKQNILFTVKRSPVCFRRPRRLFSQQKELLVAHSRVKDQTIKNKHHCLLLLGKGKWSHSQFTQDSADDTDWMCHSSLFKFIAYSPLFFFPPFLFLLFVFKQKFTLLLLLQDSEVPICILSCSSTQVPREIWGHVWSSRDGRPVPMPPGLLSRDPYRMNEGRTHRTKLQDCYRCHTDATDIPTFLKIEGEGRRASMRNKEREAELQWEIKKNTENSNLSCSWC